MSKRAEKKLETRSKIIQSALSLSAEKGFSSLSLREVASDAGITPAAFYHHFEDMEELGLSLLDEVGVSLRRLLRKARKKSKVAQGSLTDFSVETFRDYVNQNSNLFRLLLGERQGASKKFRKAIHAEMDLFISELTDDLDRIGDLRKEPLINSSFAAEAIVAVVFTIGAEFLDLPKHRQESLSLRLVAEINMILRGAKLLQD